jgi:hypothetical protein
MSATKSLTHCLAALAAHIQSRAKSVLSEVYVEKADNEKCPTARLTNEDWCNINEGRKTQLRMKCGEDPTAANNCVL